MKRTSFFLYFDKVGISEPAIFAVNLKYSVKPFICACLGAGFGGAFMKLTSVRAIGQGLTGILGLLIVVPEKLVFYIIGNLIAFILPIVFILFYDKTKGIPKGDEEEVDVQQEAEAKSNEKISLHAVVDGQAIPIEQIGDGVFSEKVLGEGIGIIPDSQTVVAPADGTVNVIMEGSNHAVGLTLKNGIDILIHVGVDTVGMNGEGFSCFVKVGDKVKAGDKLLTFDKGKIESKGLNPVVVVIETEGDQSQHISFRSGMKVKAGEDLIGD